MTPSIIHAIQHRISVRSYTSQPLAKHVVERVIDFTRTVHHGPFGHMVRFTLVDTTRADRSELRQLGTYGMIRGARRFIAGSIVGGPRTMEDFGFCMEQVILLAATLGLGTCWLGGTFNRSGFARKLGLASGELLPAVTPLGYPRDHRTLRERLIRKLAGSDNRKPWESLFFRDSYSSPLVEDNSERYLLPLQCVRAGPSASNKQPWRVIRAGDAYHFFLARNNGYAKQLGYDIQKVDLGIAMCHFQLAAEELALSGAWKDSKPGIAAGEWEYITSWQPAE